jgi:hypothetical protein
MLRLGSSVSALSPCVSLFACLQATADPKMAKLEELVLEHFRTHTGTHLSRSFES